MRSLKMRSTETSSPEAVHERSSRHKNLIPENLLLRDRQLTRTNDEQNIDTSPRNEQQRAVKREEPSHFPSQICQRAIGFTATICIWHSSMSLASVPQASQRWKSQGEL